MILVTGGTGYIGSHTCVALSEAGIEYAVLDNFCNSDPGVLERIRSITGQPFPFFKGDVRDPSLLRHIFDAQKISGVIHFAGLKAVGESVAQPLEYFDTNVAGSVGVLQAMNRAGCKRMVFSSSATVYGDGAVMPLTENMPCAATSPYGRTKLMVEEILADLEQSDPSWHIVRLRYFNPAGAHESGLIGENPRGVPNNLMPFVAQVAAGLRPIGAKLSEICLLFRIICTQKHSKFVILRKNKPRSPLNLALMGLRPVLTVFGGDYPTPDGTGVRDFIHVMDLAQGHVAALKRLEQPSNGLVINLGTGKGTSVLEMIRAFEKASGRNIPYKIAGRRPGDVAVCFADVQRARQILGWQAKRNIDDMCRDMWRWQLGDHSAD